MKEKLEEIKALQKLVRDLWLFIENDGETEDFFRMRERVRNLVGGEE